MSLNTLEILEKNPQFEMQSQSATGLSKRALKKLKKLQNNELKVPDSPNNTFNMNQQKNDTLKAQRQNAPLGFRKGKFAKLNVDTSKKQQYIQDDHSARKVKTCLLKKEQQKVILPSARMFQKKFKKPLYDDTYKQIDFRPNFDQFIQVKNMPGFNMKCNKTRNFKQQTMSSNRKFNKPIVEQVDKFQMINQQKNIQSARKSNSPYANKIYRKPLNVRQQKVVQFQNHSLNYSKEEITQQINQITKQILNEMSISENQKFNNSNDNNSEQWLQNHFESLKLIQGLLKKNTNQKKCHEEQIENVKKENNTICEQKDSLIQLQGNEIRGLRQITKIQNTIQESLVFDDLEIDYNSFGSPKLMKNQSIIYNSEKMDMEQSPKVRYNKKSKQNDNKESGMAQKTNEDQQNGHTVLKIEKNQIEEYLDDTSESTSINSLELQQSNEGNEDFQIQLSNIKKFKQDKDNQISDLLTVNSNPSLQNNIIINKNQNIQKIIKNYNQKDFKNLFANISQNRNSSVSQTLNKQTFCKSERCKTVHTL